MGRSEGRGERETDVNAANIPWNNPNNNAGVSPARTLAKAPGSEVPMKHAFDASPTNALGEVPLNVRE